MKVKNIIFWAVKATMKNVTNRMICFSLEITKTPIVNEIKMFIVVDIYPSYLLREL